MDREPKLVNVPGDNRDEGVWRSPDFLASNRDEFNKEDWENNRQTRNRQNAENKAEREKITRRLKRLGAIALLTVATGLGIWKVEDGAQRVQRAEQARQKTEEEYEQEQERQIKIASEVRAEFGDAESITVNGNSVTVRIPGEDGVTNKYTFYEYDSSTNEPLVKGGEATTLEYDGDGKEKEGDITVRSDAEERIDAMRDNLDRQLELAKGE